MSASIKTTGNARTKRNGSWIYHVFAIITITIWGLSFVSTKVLLDNGLHPVEIYIYRFLFAYLIVLAFNHRRLFCSNWPDEFLFAVCGLSGGSIYFIAENTALQYTLVSNVSLLTSMSPIITAMLVGLVYKSERPGRGMMVGSMVAFCGAACVIFNSSFNVSIKPLGDMLALAAAFGWSLYSIVLRKLNVEYDLWFVTRKTFFYGVLTAFPFLAFEPELADPARILSNTTVLVNILFLSLGASLIGYALWAVIVKNMGAIKANNYMYLQPVVTLVASVLLIGERITVIGLLGCVLILGGLCLGEKLSSRR